MSNRTNKRKSINVRNIKGPNALWLLLVFLVGGLIYLFWYNSVHRDIKTLTYSTFWMAVEGDKVKDVTVQDQYLRGMLKNNDYFEVNIVPSEKLWELLRVHGVNIRIEPLEKNVWGAYFFLLFKV